jgi:hypothetical protein
MHAWTHELLQHLDAGRAGLCAALAAIAPGDRERAPGASRWSAANVLSHLARTEGQVAALLQRGVRRASAALPAAPSGGAPILERFDGAAVLDRRERAVAPEFAAPDLGMSSVAALAALEGARRRLCFVLLSVDGGDARGVTQAHHWFGELDFYEWVAFAGFHEQRHTAQLLEVSQAFAG